MTESILDRKLAGRVTVEQAVYIGLLLVAIFLCCFQLGVRPYHHDESIHAFYSWRIVEQGVGDYKYDPVYHGPVLYYAAALVMFLFGDDDFTGRLSAVLFGLAILAMAWPLRRHIGRVGAICFLALLTFSPAWIYFTRFIRHDIYLALPNLLAVYFALRYAESRRPGFVYLGAAAFAVAGCTKEDEYFLGPWMVLSLLLTLVWGVLRGEQKPHEAIREVTSLARASIVPFLTGLAIFFAIWIVFYTSFLQNKVYDLRANPMAVFKPTVDAISYWLGQHDIKRIGGPWWYYVPQLVFYEPLILFPALAFSFRAFLQKRPPDRFTRFTILWSLGTLGFYGWAQEKVPWLLVPQIMPLALVAARWYASLIERRRLLQPALLAPLAVVALVTLNSLRLSNYVWDAPKPEEPGASLNPPVRHGEMLAYVQSTYDIHKIMRRVEEIAKITGKGTDTRLAIGGDATWPFSWYVRRYPVNWAANLRKVDVPLVVVDKKPEVTNAFDEALGDRFEKVPFQIRGWWEPNPNGWSMLNILPKVVRYILTRQTWSPVGSSDAVAYICKHPEKMETCVGDVSPPPPARAPEAPVALDAAGIWGKLGTERGDFNEPRDLAVDRAGNIYVVDSKNHRVQKFRPDGGFLAMWGSKGSGPGEFADPPPCGIAVGPDGSVYVADTWNHRIQKFDPEGKFLAARSEENPPLWGPRGVAVSADGTVFVTDTGNKRIVAYSANLERLRSWGTEGSKPGELIEPVGIAANEKGEVIVADTGNHRLQFFSAEGQFLREWPVSGWEEFYSEPYVDTQGEDVYVTDSGHNRFVRYRNGQFSGAWGKAGNGPGALNHPVGIAVAGAGSVYIADTHNHRVQRFDVGK